MVNHPKNKGKTGPGGRGPELTPDEEQFKQQLGAELDLTARELSSQASTQSAQRELRLKSWEVANHLVQDFRPVPWIVWKLIRSVLGKPGRVGEILPVAFDAVDKLVYQAARDKTLGKALGDEASEAGNLPLTKVIGAIGGDVAVAVCFIHCCCRRVALRLHERVWKPILDDALLRARIGYHLGAAAPGFGAGRGMLAGFAGRLGLAIQISSGDLAKAQQALEALAKGIEISEVGLETYGCDPLQVSALSLTAAGCSRDAALGTASYSMGADTQLDRGSEEFKWFAAFSIVEMLRIGREKDITSEMWGALKVSGESKIELVQNTKSAQRRGSGWQWMTLPLLAGERSVRT